MRVRMLVDLTIKGSYENTAEVIDYINYATADDLLLHANAVGDSLGSVMVLEVREIMDMEES